MYDSDHEHELGAPTQEQWRLYEKHVRDIHQGLDPEARVTWNDRVIGILSGTPREIDVLVSGKIAGYELSIAVECKHYARPLGIGAVDEFAGKLLDLGVERGALFALNGLTDPAEKRARAAPVPRIEVGDLSPGTGSGEIDLQRLFSSFGDCQNEQCHAGDVRWFIWLSENHAIRAGSCWACGAWAAVCPECGDTNAFWMDEVSCSCGVVLSLEYDRKGIEVEDIEVRNSQYAAIYTPDEPAPRQEWENQ